MENGRAAAPKPPPWFLLPPASLGEMAAIAINGFLSQLAGAPWLMAPLGASCILAFGAPDSSLARPRSIIGGHLLSCLVSLLALRLPGDRYLAAALAVGLSLALMALCRGLHAPAGATPLLAMASHPQLVFLLPPVLAGSLAIVAVAWLINNRRAPGSCPRYWL
ncbi:HPP family protein [Xenophilus sp. AP218F]|nr:HPP family protein [Xenophilus sp. AP218F]